MPACTVFQSRRRRRMGSRWRDGRSVLLGRECRRERCAHGSVRDDGGPPLPWCRHQSCRDPSGAGFFKSQPRTGHTREPDPTHNELKHTTTRKTESAGFFHFAGQGSVFISHLASRKILSRTPTRQIEQPRTISQSVSQLFHGPAPRSPLHRTDRGSNVV